jgi:outer membrane protein TolC
VYLKHASEKNPLLQQKYTEYRAALEKVPQASSLSDPQLEMGFFITPMEQLGGKQYADIKLMQMFPWFGTLKAAGDEAGKMALARFEAFLDARLQVLQEVRSNWYELNKTVESVRILEKNVELLKAIEQLATAKYKSGGTAIQSMQPGAMVPQESGLAEIYRIQIEELELRNEISSLKDSEKTTTAVFNSYLNREPDAKISLPDTIRPDTLIFPLDVVCDSMLNTNPMLLMRRYEQQSLESKKKMVALMGYPMAGLGLNYSVIGKSGMSTSSMNGRDMIMPMISLSLPIYRKKYNAMQKEAVYLEESSKAGYQDALRSLQIEYLKAVQSYNDAGRRLKLYSAQQDLEMKTFNILIKSYSASGASLSEVLMASGEQRDYEMKLVEAVADYNTSIAMLERLMAYCEIINTEKKR